MLFVRLALLLFAIGFAADVHAEDRADDVDHASGPYIGGSFAIGFEQAQIPRRYRNHEDFDEAFGFDVWAGVRVNRFFAMEAEFLAIEGFETRYEGIPVEFEAIGGTANLKLYPVAGRVQPFIVGGVGLGQLKGKAVGESESRSSLIYRVGAGVDIYIFKSVALVAGADYIITKHNIADFLEVKAGLQYQF